MWGKSPVDYEFYLKFETAEYAKTGVDSLKSLQPRPIRCAIAPQPDSVFTQGIETRPNCRGLCSSWMTVNSEVAPFSVREGLATNRPSREKARETLSRILPPGNGPDGRAPDSGLGGTAGKPF
jgi:hypothetical protein